MIVSKKILLYTDESTAGGAAHYNHTLIESLVEAGWRVHSAQPPNDSPMLELQRQFGVEQSFLSYEPRVEFVRSITDTADPERIIEVANPDIIFFSDCCPLSNIAAKHIAITREIPYVVMCHSGAAYLAEKFPTCLGMVRHQNNFARQVIAISPRSLAILRHTFGLASEKGVFILNGRPAKYFAPPDSAARQRIRRELQIPAHGVLCFTSARFDGGKGYQHQLQAIKLLQDKNLLGQLYFAWAGIGDLHIQIGQVIATNGWSSRIMLLGQRWDIVDLLDAADLFVLPTLNEGGLPLAAMEAMAKGVPTIITAVSGIDEIVGQACRLLPDPNTNPTETVSELARGLLELSHDLVARKQLGIAGQQLAEKLFTQRTNLQQTMAVITSSLIPLNAVKTGPTPAPSQSPKIAEPIEFLVSAIVSTYKSERFIAGCLEDLTAQTLFTQGRMEIVVVDSCSPENEGAIIRQFQKEHHNIVYLRTDERETLYAAWNRGISVARGRFITNANTDDRHRGNALELMALALEASPDVALVYGDCYLSTIPNERFDENSCNRIYLYPDFFAPAALLHYQFGPQPMWRKSVHDTIGFFDGTMRAAGDYDFNLRFAQKFTAMHLPVALGSYLAHEGAISFADGTMQRENQQIAAHYQNDATIEALYAQAGIASKSKADQALLQLDLGLRAFEFFPPWNEGRPGSNPAFAAKCFMRSIELNPHRPHALNNLFCLLAWAGRKADALTMLANLPALANDPVISANRTRVQLPDFAPGQAGSLLFIASGLGLRDQRQLTYGLAQKTAIAL